MRAVTSLNTFLLGTKWKPEHITRSRQCQGRPCLGKLQWRSPVSLEWPKERVGRLVGKQSSILCPFRRHIHNCISSSPHKKYYYVISTYIVDFKISFRLKTKIITVRFERSWKSFNDLKAYGCSRSLLLVFRNEY